MMDEIHILEDSVKNWVLILHTYVIALILGAAVLMFFNVSEAAPVANEATFRIEYTPKPGTHAVHLFAITDEQASVGRTFFDWHRQVFDGEPTRPVWPKETYRYLAVGYNTHPLDRLWDPNTMRSRSIWAGAATRVMVNGFVLADGHNVLGHDISGAWNKLEVDPRADRDAPMTYGTVKINGRPCVVETFKYHDNNTDWNILMLDKAWVCLIPQSN